MDLSTVLSRVDARAYSTAHEYLADVAKIAQARTVAGPTGVWALLPPGCVLAHRRRTAGLSACVGRSMPTAGGVGPPPPRGAVRARVLGQRPTRRARDLPRQRPRRRGPLRARQGGAAAAGGAPGGDGGQRGACPATCK